MTRSIGMTSVGGEGGLEDLGAGLPRCRPPAAGRGLVLGGDEGGQGLGAVVGEPACRVGVRGEVGDEGGPACWRHTRSTQRTAAWRAGGVAVEGEDDRSGGQGGDGSCLGLGDGGAERGAGCEFVGRPAVAAAAVMARASRGPSTTTTVASRRVAEVGW